MSGSSGEPPATKPEETGAADVAQLLEVLRAAIQLRKVSSRQIEREMGLSIGFLTRILTGQVSLRVSHVLQICAILDVAPGDVWAAVFPSADEHLSRVLKDMAVIRKRSTKREPLS